MQIVVYVTHWDELGSDQRFGCDGLGGYVGEVGASFTAVEGGEVSALLTLEVCGNLAVGTFPQGWNKKDLLAQCDRHFSTVHALLEVSIALSKLISRLETH